MNRAQRSSRIKPGRHRATRLVSCLCRKHALTKQIARSKAVQLTKEKGFHWSAFKCPYRSDVWHVSPTGNPVGPVETRENLRAGLQNRRPR